MKLELSAKHACYIASEVAKVTTCIVILWLASTRDCPDGDAVAVEDWLLVAGALPIAAYGLTLLGAALLVLWRIWLAGSDEKGKSTWIVEVKEIRTVALLVELLQNIFYLIWVPIGIVAVGTAPCLAGLVAAALLLEILLIIRGVVVFFYRFARCCECCEGCCCQ
jgi:hypothetical protein